MKNIYLNGRKIEILIEKKDALPDERIRGIPISPAQPIIDNRKITTISECSLREWMIKNNWNYPSKFYPSNETEYIWECVGDDEITFIDGKPYNYNTNISPVYVKVDKFTAKQIDSLFDELLNSNKFKSFEQFNSQIDNPLTVKEILYSNTLKIFKNKKYTLNKDVGINTQIHHQLTLINDLLFQFNSFLLNYSLYKKYTLTEKLSEIRNNGNSIKDLSSIVVNLQKIKTNYHGLFRIYEVFFRHMYAHGYLYNLILNLVLKSKSNLFVLIKNDDSDFRIRLLITKENFLDFQKDNTKIIPCLEMEVLNHKEIYVFLDEDSTRKYIKQQGHYFTMQPTFLLENKIQNYYDKNIKSIDRLIPIRYTDNENNIPEEPNIYWTLESIEKDINDFIDLLEE